MADEAGPAVVRVDSEGVIRHWSPEWENASGYAAAEAVGHKVDLIIPPALRERHWRGFHKAIETRALRQGDADGRWKLKTVAVHKSGKLVPLRATLELTYADDGAVNGAEGTFLGPGPAWTAPVARAIFGALSLGQSARRRSRPAS
jgi:PAS domain S-box-containing protein